VKIRAEQALLPVVAHRASHSLGDGLVDAIGDPCLVVKELLVGMNVFSARRREAHHAGRAGRCCRLDVGGLDGQDLGLLVLTPKRRLSTPRGIVLVLARLDCRSRAREQRDSRRGHCWQLTGSVASGGAAGVGAAKAVIYNGGR
jgi:hypothetical protein